MSSIIHYVRVAVALSRPPKIDEWRRYCVVAANRHEAELIAQQMASCTSVMPVKSQWESSHRAGPVEPFGAMGCRCWKVNWDDEIADGEEGWMMEPDCPHHSEGTAAWAALDGCPACAEFGECLDCQEVRENPPTPETANAGGPDIDDTPVIAVCTRLDHRCGPPDVGQGPCNGWPRTKTYGYATGAIVPDELKRKMCTCPMVDVSSMLEGPSHTYTRGRIADDCPLHTAPLSPGRVECIHCDDWVCNYGGPGQGTAADALIALRHHRCNIITEGGLTECSSLSQQRPRTWWGRLLRKSEMIRGPKYRDMG